MRCGGKGMLGMNSQERIYYLDVLRALAIMLVFTGHTVSSYGPTNITGPLQFGGTGVDLFFLLSGWLIGSQLFSEYKKFGNIDVKRFWIRRWMRTFPAYFAVLIFTLCQLYLSKDAVQSPLPYFTFTQNYFTPLTYFSVSWSLAVEEQFYLVIAPLIVLISIYKKVPVQLTILLLLLLLPSLFRLMEMYSSLKETHVRWDCCLMGVILAFVHHRIPNLWIKLKTYNLLFLSVGITLYLCFFYFRWIPPFPSYQDPSKLILAFVFGSMVLFAVNTPTKKIPIAHALFMHISTRSYSIYLLHPDALALCKRLIPQSHLIIYYCCAFFISLVAAEVAYKIVEQPFIKLRSRFDVSKRREKHYAAA